MSLETEDCPRCKGIGKLVVQAQDTSEPASVPLCTNCGRYPQSHIYRVRPGGYARICSGCAASIPGSEPLARFTREADAAPAQQTTEPCPHDELGVFDNDGFRPCLKCGVVRRWPESTPAPEPRKVIMSRTALEERITQLEAALAEKTELLATALEQHEAMGETLAVTHRESEAALAEARERVQICEDALLVWLDNRERLELERDAALARAETAEKDAEEITRTSNTNWATCQQLRADLEAARAALRAQTEHHSLALCAQCADTAAGYGELAELLTAIETPLGLADGLGSFQPRIRRIVDSLRAQTREAFDGGWRSGGAVCDCAACNVKRDEAYAAWQARQQKEPEAVTFQIPVAFGLQLGDGTPDGAAEAAKKLARLDGVESKEPQ